MRPQVLEDIDPLNEPVTPERFAYYAKIDEDLTGAEGLLVGDLLKEAREYCEEYTGLSFGPKTLEYRVTRASWKGKNSLPYGPNITLGEIVDSEGNPVPMDEFSSSTWQAEYGKGMSVNNTFKEDYGYGFGYPDAPIYEEEYTVTYTAGYAPGKLPSPIKRAIAKLALELYQNRENTVIGTIVAELPTGVKELLNPYRAKVAF